MYEASQNTILVIEMPDLLACAHIFKKISFGTIFFCIPIRQANIKDFFFLLELE